MESGGESEWPVLVRAGALLELGRPREAEELLRSGLAQEPDSAEIHHLLAVALVSQDDTTSALDHARAAVRLDPEQPASLELLALTLAEVGRGREAYDTALRAVQLAPHDWGSHVAVSHALTFGGEGREALPTAESAARRAVELAPHQPDAHVMLGIVRWRLHDVAQARQAFTHALSLDPEHADAQRNLAALQIAGVQLADGAGTLSRALASHPQDRGMHRELERAHERVLARLTFWFVLVALTFGGFVLVTDFLLRQRVFFGLVYVFACGAHAVKVLRLLPTGQRRGLLPWLASSGQRARAWFDWILLSGACLVWFTPSAVAEPAWFALAGVILLVPVWWVLRGLFLHLLDRVRSRAGDRRAGQ